MLPQNVGKPSNVTSYARRMDIPNNCIYIFPQCNWFMGTHHSNTLCAWNLLSELTTYFEMGAKKKKTPKKKLSLNILFFSCYYLPNRDYSYFLSSLCQIPACYTAITHSYTTRAENYFTGHNPEPFHSQQTITTYVTNRIYFRNQSAILQTGIVNQNGEKITCYYVI